MLHGDTKTSEAIKVRDDLSNRLKLVGVNTPEGQKILLALMPFYAPGGLAVADAEEKLGKLVFEIYEQRYITKADKKVDTNKDINNNQNIEKGESDFNDRIFLNRMLGLSNLYYIDPRIKRYWES